MPILLDTDDTLERELSEAFKRKLRRLAKAQAIAWNALHSEEQQRYLELVDRLEAEK